jgi:hypothetical protein
MSHRHEVVECVSSFQIAINELAPGPVKATMQEQLDALIVALANGNVCGPLRVGHEVPAAS